MNNKFAIYTLALGIFMTGYVTGAIRQRNHTVKRLSVTQPLITDLVLKLADMIASKEMNEADIRAYAEEQLNFIKIVSR